MTRTRKKSSGSAAAALPPPPYEAHQRSPTTLTMRAILDEAAELPAAVVPEPGESFEALFYGGVDAYLGGDYPRALSLFERAMPLEVGTTTCRNNVAILRTLLDRDRAK